MRGKDVLWGMGWGLFGGVLYTGIAGAMLIGGAGQTSMPKIVLLAIYPLAGIVAGSLVGLFRTRLQSRRFSQILGGSLGSPLGLVILWLEKGSLTDLEPAGLVGVTVGMFVLGWFGGGIFWNRLHDVS